jgi:trimethylamine--corrinoid protein Co-methyltransferase
VSDEALALDVIKEKGPEGQYLETQHTHKHFRERWYPDLFERKTYDMWAGEGGKTLAQRASDKVADILSTHEPEPLPREIATKLRQIVET